MVQLEGPLEVEVASAAEGKQAQLALAGTTVAGTLQEMATMAVFEQIGAKLENIFGFLC